MQIFNINNELIIDVELDEKSFIQRSIMGDDYIQLNFTIDKYIEIGLGSYINYETKDINDNIINVKYKANVLPNTNKKSNKEYVYTCIFESAKYDMSKIILKFDDKLNFYLNADIEQIQDLIILNMNNQGWGTWQKGTTAITGYLDFNFSGENCLQALNRACQSFDVEYEVVYLDNNFVLNVRSSIGVSKDITLSYKKGLYSFTRKRVDDRNITTKLYVLGGSKNIPAEYGNERITIDPIETGTGNGIFESTIIFDEVFPSFDGSVNFESGDTFRDFDIDFNLNNQLIPNVIAKVNFTSGLLAGYTFDVLSFDNTTKAVTLKTLINDIGESLPNATNKINVGDTYNFTDIYMPQTYVDAAEAELLSRGTEYINKENTPLLLYSTVIDERFIRENNIQLLIGDKINILDYQMLFTVEMRIYSVKQALVNEYNYQIELSNNLRNNRLIDITNNQYSIERTLDQLKKELKILKNN